MAEKKVTVCRYDPGWPEEFQKISCEIANGLGEMICRVEHVGSTSVPGLAAKPVIDLDVVIPDHGHMGAVIAKLRKLGYEYEGDLGISGREAFRYEGKSHLYRHHLYVCRRSSRELKRHLTFRDYLRGHPDAAAEYGRVKLEAARLYPDSMDGYMRHKSGCIQRLYVLCGLESC